MQFIEKYYDFSYGHRVFNHESQCARLHGHNGRAHFMLVGTLDDVGRIMDFGEVTKRLCKWLEDNWDHKFLVWNQDPWSEKLLSLDSTVVLLSFNPTAENLSKFLVEEIGPIQLQGTNVKLVGCRFEETRKCSATFLCNG